MTFNLAYIAGGKLHLKCGDAAVQTVESEFGQSVQERMQQMQRRNAWKNQNIMANFLPPGMVQSLEEQMQPALPVAFRGLCRGGDGRLIYTLEAGDVAGIFTLDHAKSAEQRLFHGSDFKVQHLDFHSDRNLIACSAVHSDGAANIAVMQLDGARPREVTEGDSVDLAPRWIPGAGRSLVFQSAGIGRNSAGFPVAQAPFTIERLDFEGQEVTTLAAHPKYDFLGPQMTADGSLYYIRRPYRSSNSGFHPLRLLRDIVMMPVRLLYAIYQWLNFFTRRYTGKPLMTTGQPKVQPLNQLMVWGSAINADEMAERNRRFGDADSPALVPRTWQLIRQISGREPEVIADGVLAFDVAEDGAIAYSNGSAIYAIRPGGVAERVIVDRPIEHVILLQSNLAEESITS
jgi:hypothetical protein